VRTHNQSIMEGMIPEMNNNTNILFKKFKKPLIPNTIKLTSPLVSDLFISNFNCYVIKTVVLMLFSVRLRSGVRGETGRSLTVRVKESTNNVRFGRKNNGIFCCVRDTDHCKSWGSGKLVFKSN
jgi:hypothetical protein